MDRAKAAADAWNSSNAHAAKDADKRFFRYSELSPKAQKEAYDRFSWDWKNNKRLDVNKETVIGWLNKHWFDKDGGTYLGGNGSNPNIT